MVESTQKIGLPMEEKLPELARRLLDQLALALIFDQRLLEDADAVFYAKLARRVEIALSSMGKSDEQLAAAYLRFASRYASDIRQFHATGAYPDPARRSEGLRTDDYQVTLLLSVLLNAPRYPLFAALEATCPSGKTTAAIGCGVGLEAQMLVERDNRVDMYEPNPCAATRELALRPGMTLEASPFSPDTAKERYDCIYLIELLEHVSDPRALLGLAVERTQNGGRIFATTATDMPQFDHVYNFRFGELGRWATEHGLEVERHDVFEHHLKESLCRPLNELFVLVKP